MTGERILVTGASGFIGFTLVKKLIQSGFTDVIGIDNFSAPYGSHHCDRRAAVLERNFQFRIHKLDLIDKSSFQSLYKLAPFDYIIHLAAWPGVRFGQEKPSYYYRNNVNAFGNVLEFVNEVKPSKFLFASSSSVYGNQGTSGPVRENELSARDLRSFYATTKLMNEISARSYAEISKVPTIALRFFTVYGPEGRPDMAYWKFLAGILKDEVLELYGTDGGMRSFTYVDDVVDAVQIILRSNIKDYQALNIASSLPGKTFELVQLMGEITGIAPKVRVIDRPPYDVDITHADLTLLDEFAGERQETSISNGLRKFVEWYREDFSRTSNREKYETK